MHDVHDLLQTLTVAMFAAVVLQVVAARMRLPAIVFLLAGGVILGPEGFGVVRPESLSHGLEVIVSLAVAVILFEGGLTLDTDGFKQAPAVIRRMLTIGVGITWLAVALAVWLLFDFSIGFSLLAASLVIVTGPTVIGPILRRARVSSRLHQILHWEGVLIDPIGVFVALACFEVMVHEPTVLGVVGQGGAFFLRVAIGLAVGWALGMLIAEILRREWVVEEHQNLFVLTAALVIFFLADSLAEEAGLLAVTVAGLVLGLRKIESIRSIKKFKLEITELAIGVLFIVLAARLEIGDFARLGGAGLVLLLVVLLVVRPLNVAVATVGSPVTGRERLFLSWMAPRGIVAASMASLFTLVLSQDPDYADQAWFLETFTYAVIAATVVLQGLPAAFLAKLLGVTRRERGTWLFVGADPFARRAALRLQEAGQSVMLVDVNADKVQDAGLEGLEAYVRDALDPELLEDPKFLDVASVIAMTGNSALDELACSRWEHTASRGTYRVGFDDSSAASGGYAAVRHGTPIWGDLGPIPTVEGELELGDVDLVLHTGGERPDHAEAFRPLFYITGDQAVVEPNPRSAPPAESGVTLALVRERRWLPGFLKDMVDFEARPKSEGAVYSALLQRARLYRPGLDVSGILPDLLEDHDFASSYVGFGVAIPHAYCGNIDQSICIGARLVNPMPARIEGEPPVRLVFLLLSPTGEGQQHLRALAELASLVSDEEIRERLLAADSSVSGMRIVLDTAGHSREVYAVPDDDKS